MYTEYYFFAIYFMHTFLLLKYCIIKIHRYLLNKFRRLIHINKIVYNPFTFKCIKQVILSHLCNLEVEESTKAMNIE